MRSTSTNFSAVHVLTSPNLQPMKKIFLILTFIATGVTLGSAQSPTWSEDVASVIYANCSSCHHEGGIGPFSLMTYQDAVDNAYGIQSQVEAKLMPPWKPGKQNGKAVKCRFVLPIKFKLAV